ncbi:uncharacterized protein LOC113525845 isoform X2 [Pangasianodon hypophthalmus]|uniref:uncharacterized protein LOC113525845 isoform X2 n=2 Tax=Pangasianodon hypophthalmus TaxID=310915 RepID=UPI0023075D92|nr:uncharacterized protein LOC113525845 isoform X2 [Pangasianodon hypophthalmus]
MEHEGRSLVLYFLFIFSVGYVYSENIATGTTYTFRPTIQGKIETFDWRHAGNLVVEWDPDNGAHWYRYGERAHINTDTADLTLQVKKEDSGVFKGQFQVKGVLQYFERTITVIDPVPEPKVACKQNDTGITLLCSVDPSVQAAFTWTGPNEFSHVGESVHIPRKSDDAVYFCTAKNLVSEKTTEFTLKMCPEGEVNDDGGNGGAIAGGIIGILLLVAIAVAAYYFGIKKKDQSDVRLPLGTSNSHNANGGDDTLSKQDKENQ